MKYKLLKEKITDLGFYGWSDKSGSVECCGFSNFELGQDVEQVAILPDIVEELNPWPIGMIQFEDWNQVVEPLLKNDFFFEMKPGFRRNWKGSESGSSRYILKETSTIIHISRDWLLPISESLSD